MAANREECRGRSIQILLKTAYPTMYPRISISSSVFSEVLYLLKSRKPSLLLERVSERMRRSLKQGRKSVRVRRLPLQLILVLFLESRSDFLSSRRDFTRVERLLSSVIRVVQGELDVALLMLVLISFTKASLQVQSINDLLRQGGYIFNYFNHSLPSLELKNSFRPSMHLWNT